MVGQCKMPAVTARESLKMERHHSPVAPYRAPIKELEHAIVCLRRRYGRGLNRRPTADELAAMRRAAELTIIADHARTDPLADANTIVRLENAASRARSAMQTLLDVNTPDEPLPTLDEMLESAS